MAPFPYVVEPKGEELAQMILTAGIIMLVIVLGSIGMAVLTLWEKEGTNQHPKDKTDKIKPKGTGKSKTFKLNQEGEDAIQVLQTLGFKRGDAKGRILKVFNTAGVEGMKAEQIVKEALK